MVVLVILTTVVRSRGALETSEIHRMKLWRQLRQSVRDRQTKKERDQADDDHQVIAQERPFIAL